MIEMRCRELGPTESADSVCFHFDEGQYAGRWILEYRYAINPHPGFIMNAQTQWSPWNAVPWVRLPPPPVPLREAA